MEYPPEVLEQQKKLIAMFEDAIEQTKKKYNEIDPEYCRSSILQAQETISELRAQLKEMEKKNESCTTDHK